MSSEYTAHAGVVLGLDPGAVRIGVARQVDPASSLAVALPTIVQGEFAIPQIIEILDSVTPRLVVVGLPLRMDGTLGPAARASLDFARALGGRSTIPVRMIDERLTTVQAQRRLHAAGEDVRASRAKIDAASAIILVEAVLAGVPSRDPAEFD